MNRESVEGEITELEKLKNLERGALSRFRESMPTTTAVAAAFFALTAAVPERAEAFDPNKLFEQIREQARPATPHAETVFGKSFKDVIPSGADSLDSETQYGSGEIDLDSPHSYCNSFDAHQTQNLAFERIELGENAGVIVQAVTNEDGHTVRWTVEIVLKNGAEQRIDCLQK